MRSVAAAVEHGGVVFLRALGVFVPPHTECRRVMRGYRADAAIGIARKMAETNVWIFGHRLEFEREDAEFVHHPLYTVGRLPIRESHGPPRLGQDRL